MAFTSILQRISLTVEIIMKADFTANLPKNEIVVLKDKWRKAYASWKERRSTL